MQSKYYLTGALGGSVQSAAAAPPWEQHVFLSKPPQLHSKEGEIGIRHHLSGWVLKYWQECLYKQMEGHSFPTLRNSQFTRQTKIHREAYTTEKVLIWQLAALARASSFPGLELCLTPSWPQPQNQQVIFYTSHLRTTFQRIKYSWALEIC